MPTVERSKTADSYALFEGETETAVSLWAEAHGEKTHWRKPLLSVASADDELFPRLREVVDPGHAMPSDLLPGARSVLVFFLPFQRWIGEENDGEEFYSSTSWADMYIETNLLIREICNYLKGCLNELGYGAATTPATHNFDEVKLVSRWSHKHLGYIAGLGTFGHHLQLITKAGCCGRLGSIVTDMPIAPTPRPGVEWCLVKAGKSCHACVAKCRFGALTKESYDRHVCYDQLLRNVRRHQGPSVTDVCGKCACELPCSYQIPPALLRTAARSTSR